MSLLEIEVPKETTDAATTSTEVAPRRMSLRRNSDICADSLHRTNRRVISKPKKNTKNAATNPTTESEIRKLYLNQKITKLKTTLLETIFERKEEEEAGSSDNPNELSGQVKLIGSRKIKRCLSFSLGTNPTKTLVQKRRKRIQSTFGGKLKSKKISMDAFLHKFKLLQESNGCLPKIQG